MYNIRVENTNVMNTKYELAFLVLSLVNIYIYIYIYENVLS